MSLVELYKGQTFYTLEICGLTRKLPIRQVDDGVWIASNHQLVLGTDIEFTERVGRELAFRIKEYRPDYLFTAEAKSLPLVYETARNLKQKRIIVARKNPKAYMNDFVVEEVRSITTKEPQKLVIDKEDIELIRGKRICPTDDVVSTGSTMNALEKLVYRGGGEVVCRAAVWLEGPWYDRNLIHLSTLPIFVTEEKYGLYKNEKGRINKKS